MRHLLLALVFGFGCGDDDGGSNTTGDANLGSGADGASPTSLFTEPLQLPTMGPLAVAALDVNGDGADDLLIAIVMQTTGSPTLLVRTGNTDRTFATAVPYVTTVSSDSIRLADVDNNGVVDAVMGGFSQKITVLPGVAGGTFAAEIVSTVAASTSDLIVGKFDADANFDVITGPTSGTQNAVTFAPGAGNGMFGAGTVVPLGTGVDSYHACTGDFDADGKLDFAIGDFLDDFVVVYAGAGNGTFAERSRLAIGSPGEVMAGDLDGDTKLDLAVISPGKVMVARGNGDGTFQAPVGHLAKTATIRGELGDVNGDGKLDVVAADTISERFHVLLGNGDGTLQTAIAFVADNFQDFTIGDFDNDGRPDLAMALSMTNEVLVYFGAP